MRKTFLTILTMGVAVLLSGPSVIAAEEPCITCHRDISPGQVADWQASKHSQEDVTC